MGLWIERLGESPYGGGLVCAGFTPDESYASDRLEALHPGAELFEVPGVEDGGSWDVLRERDLAKPVGLL
ncbi:MAG: hypothetical protein NUW23_10725 [Firmicutes bacterium]|jgi:hypothetical protein|nr:hypothetical protein [Bacillota bacterium]